MACQNRLELLLSWYNANIQSRLHANKNGAGSSIITLFKQSPERYPLDHLYKKKKHTIIPINYLDAFSGTCKCMDRLSMHALHPTRSPHENRVLYIFTTINSCLLVSNHFYLYLWSSNSHNVHVASVLMGTVEADANLVMIAKCCAHVDSMFWQKKRLNICLLLSKSSRNCASMKKQCKMEILEVLSQMQLQIGTKPQSSFLFKVNTIEAMLPTVCWWYSK
jgi:hypothetical protein